MLRHSALRSLKKKTRTSRSSARRKPIPPVLQRLSAQKCTWKMKLKPLFTRQLATEEFSRIRGYNPKDPLLYERERLKTIRGPGYYNPIDHTYKETSTVPNKGFTTSLRSSLIRNKNYPAPGTYLPDIFKDSSVIKKSASKIPLFQWNKYKNRFKPELSYKWRQCPTQYKPNDMGSFEALLKKKVSTRGPYDLFTGPRNYSNIKNHFCQKALDAPDKVYDIKNEGFDYLLKHPRKKNYGVVYRKSSYTTKDFFRDRYSSLTAIPQEVEVPGPTTYNLTSHTIKAKPRSKVPFNSTQHLSRIPDKITPGPGRYFLTYKPIWRKRSSHSTTQSKYLQTTQEVAIVKTRDLKKTKQLEFELKAQSLEDMREVEIYMTEPEYKPLTAKRKASYVSFLSTNRSLLKTPYMEPLCQASGNQPLKYSTWHVVPTSIQSVLLQHPAVLDVIIIGFPRQLINENPFALVILRDGFSTISERCLLDYLNHKLAFRNHIQGGLVIVKDEDVIRTDSGKLTASTISTKIKHNPKSNTTLISGRAKYGAGTLSK